MTPPAPVEVHDRVLVLGKTGSGKSNKAKALVAFELGRGTRVVAFDPHDEWSKRGRTSLHVHLGPLVNRCSASELMRDPERWLDEDALSLAVVPDNSPARCAEDFEAVAEAVQHTGNLFFVVEEVGHFESWCQAKLIEVACQFRHYGVPVMMIAQCATMVPKKARRQMSQLWTGRQDDPEDLEAIAKLTRNEEFADRVSRLPRGELIHWRDDFETPQSKRKEEAPCRPE